MMYKKIFSQNMLAILLKIVVPLVVFIVVVPAYTSLGLQNMLIMSAIWAIFGMAWLGILMVGEFSLGQAGFLAIGAYSSSIMTLKLGIPFWLSLPISALITALFALAIGVLVFRLKGLYFAIITFIFAEVIRLTIAQISYVGGSQGLFGMPRPTDLGPISFSTNQGWFFLVVLILIITAITYHRIGSSRIGRIYTWVANMPELAQSLGTNLMKYKIQAFVLAGFFTGLAGCVMAHYVGAIGPEGFSLWYSILAQLVAVVGGVGHLIIGPIIGSLVLTLFDEYLVLSGGLKTIAYGILLLIVIFFLREGLSGLPKRLLSAWRFDKLTWKIRRGR